MAKFRAGRRTVPLGRGRHLNRRRLEHHTETCIHLTKTQTSTHSRQILAVRVPVGLTLGDAAASSRAAIAASFSSDIWRIGLSGSSTSRAAPPAAAALVMMALETADADDADEAASRPDTTIEVPSPAEAPPGNGGSTISAHFAARNASTKIWVRWERMQGIAMRPPWPEGRGGRGHVCERERR